VCVCVCVCVCVGCRGRRGWWVQCATEREKELDRSTIRSLDCYVFCFERNPYVCSAFLPKRSDMLRSLRNCCNPILSIEYADSRCIESAESTDSIDTGWRRPIGCLYLQVIFCKRDTSYRALLRKMAYKHKASYDSTPPCGTIYRISPYHQICRFER